MLSNLSTRGFTFVAASCGGTIVAAAAVVVLVWGFSVT